MGWLKGEGREEKGRNGKGKGRETEGKGKGKGRERKGKRKGKGKGQVITLISGFKIPKQTERGDYILSEKIPKQKRNCQCFS